VPEEIPVIATLYVPGGVDGAVAIVSVDVAEPFSTGVIEVGLKEQEAPVGNPEQVSATAEVKPFSELIVIVDVADWPTSTGVGLNDVAVIEKSGATPVPESGIIRVLGVG
jgi:hypothetical protein